MSTAQEVETGEIEGPTLTALVSFMCGRLGPYPNRHTAATVHSC